MGGKEIGRLILAMSDDSRVVVPDSLEDITSYVLREQGDWFEDEIKFVRTLLLPGQRAVDIGANYGLYTLAMAKAVGADGQVWAFEPASATAHYLKESLSINDCGHVVFDSHAISDKEGVAYLQLHANPELNELVREGIDDGETERVSLTTLDSLKDSCGWDAIDFVKIDAEGEEEAIINGGRTFFDGLSPLVQYEVKAAQGISQSLVKRFLGEGYDSYQLVPGLNVLVPFIPEAGYESYLLNLFCCKGDCAAKLSARGLLVQNDDSDAQQAIASLERLLASAEGGSKYYFGHVLSSKPYFKRLLPHMSSGARLSGNTELERAISLHAIAHDAEVSITVRALALRFALRLIHASVRQATTSFRLITLARIARENGAREIAVRVLEQLVSRIVSGANDPVEPYLAASEYYEGLEPADRIDNWFVCSVLEELERCQYFSSFYSDGPDTFRRLSSIQELGFGSPEMNRRLELFKARHALI